MKIKILIPLIIILFAAIQPTLGVTAPFSLPKAVLINFSGVNISINPERVEPGQQPYSSTKIVWLLNNFDGNLIIQIYGLKESNYTFILIYKGLQRINCLIGQGKFGEYTLVIRPRPPLLDPVYRLQIPYWQYFFNF